MVMLMIDYIFQNIRNGPKFVWIMQHVVKFPIITSVDVAVAVVAVVVGGC